MTSRIFRGDWRTSRWIAVPAMRHSGFGLLVRHQLAAVAAEQPRRARTRRACGPPCSRSRTPGRTCSRCAPRRCGPRTRAGWCSPGSRSSRPSSRSCCSGPGPSVSSASWTNGPFLIAACHYCVAFPRLRPRTMSLVDAFFWCRVFRPSGLPHGDTGGRPPELLPSPPPSGWSTGFMATPRTLRALAQPAALAGLADREQLVLGVAHLADRGEAAAVHQPHLGRPEPQRDVVAFLRHHLARSSRRVRAIWPPLPILSSTLCTVVPSGISPSGSALPGPDVGARARDDGVAQLQALGVQDVALLAVGVHAAARCARVRFGSYSISATVPGIPNLFALEVDLPVLPLVPAALVPRR